MDSDTDSDSETGYTPPQRDAADFTQAFTQVSSIQPDFSWSSALGQSVNYLMSLDSLASDDCHRHGDIQAASATIAQTLDSICAYRPTTDEEWLELLSSFSKIVATGFLAKLFELRQCFHFVAASELRSSKTVAVLVCWVDVILAKIGEAAIAIASGWSSDPSPSPDRFDSLARQREDDTLRAAAQLPHAWEKVPMLLLSESASPAAVRLALCLAFAAYILRPQLTGVDSMSIGIKLSHVPDLLRIHMLRYPVDYSNVSDSGHFTQSLHETSRPRVNHAMLVSLLSTIIPLRLDQQPSLGLRPWTRTIFLQLIQSVIHPGRGAIEVRDLSPCVTLDPAQNILLRWGKSVQLCWAILDDPRCADVESVTYLTATWLYHMKNTDVLTWRHELSSTLAESPSAACMYILQLLHHCVSLLISSRFDCEAGPWSDVLYKACSAVALLSNPSYAWHVPITVEMARYMCITFALCSDTSVGLSIRDVIIDALSRVTAEVLQKAIRELVEDGRVQFSARFDETIATTRRALITAGTSSVSTAVLMLNFIAIVWKNDAYLPCHRGTVSSFLSTVVDALSEDPSASLICSLMTVLSVYEFTKLWDDEKVLEFALSGLHRNPLSASVISNYIIAMQENDTICVPIYAEAWDHISDVLLLTFRSSYDGEESLLALLVAPSLCHALCSLISHSEPNLAQWILQSPWTCHLRQELRALLATPDDDLHHDSVILKERILVSAQMLLEKTEGKVNETDKNAMLDLPRLSTEFFYHTSELGIHLILIPKQLL